MKLLLTILIFVFAPGTSLAIELSLEDEAKISNILIQTMQGQKQYQTLFLICKSSCELSNAREKAFKKIIKKLQIRSVSVEQWQALISEDPDQLYFVNQDFEQEHSSGVCLSNSFSQVRKGCLAGMQLIKTNPRIQMNLNTMKDRKLSFPSSLLRLVELVE